MTALQPPPPLFARPDAPATNRAEAPASEPYPLAAPDPAAPVTYRNGDWRACPIARLHGYPPHREGAKPWIDKPKT